MTTTTDIAVPEAPARARTPGYLFGRWIDFLCLGGGSLPIICVLILLPADQYKPYVMATVLLLSHFINNPHFMNSYQIFYENFGDKAAPGAPLRSRYLFAGVGVPVLLVSFFAWCLATGDAYLLGLSVNLMLFTVGWHYVKQGYGILMVESVMKRAFLNDREKDWLRWNALVVWILSWTTANREIHDNTFYGLEYATFAMPDPFYYAIVAVAVATGAIVLAGLASRVARGAPVAVNGLLAYVTSAYVWLMLSQFDILLLAAVPLFHSLQYLAVVWRYRLNKEEARNDGTGRLLGLFTLSKARLAMIRFVWFGVLLGALWFWVVPLALDAVVTHREDIFGQAMFVFMFVVFINVHHYFLDNVMWRRENADVKEHLFS